MVECYTFEAFRVKYASALHMSTKTEIAAIGNALCKFWSKWFTRLTNKKRVAMMFLMMFTYLFTFTELFE